MDANSRNRTRAAASSGRRLRYRTEVKKPKQPNDIAGRFRELQQLRKLVHEAELELLRNRSPRADIVSKVDGKERRPRKTLN
jgi:hypothetical protein